MSPIRTTGELSAVSTKSQSSLRASPSTSGPSTRGRFSSPTTPKRSTNHSWSSRGGTSFVEYENPILGLLSSSTSVSTSAAKLRLAAASKLLLSFGTRRVHPALAAMVERACYLAGFDGVSNVLAAKLLKLEPSGTMPHSLVQILGSQEKAWRLFDETIPRSVPRVALVDTFWDRESRINQGP